MFGKAIPRINTVTYTCKKSTSWSCFRSKNSTKQIYIRHKTKQDHSQIDGRHGREKLNAMCHKWSFLRAAAVAPARHTRHILFFSKLDPSCSKSAHLWQV